MSYASPELAQFFTLADALAVGVAAVDGTGKQTYVNPAFARMVGWSVSELVGTTAPFPYWPAEEMDNIADALRRTLAGSPGEGIDLRFQKRDGERFDVVLSLSETLFEGRPQWIAAVTDVTRQKAVEHSLADREQRLNLAMSAGRLGSWEYQLTTGKVIWSPTLEQIHGLEPGTFGGTFSDYVSDIHPEDVDYVLGTIAQSSHGAAPHHLEYRIIWPNGEVHWLEASGQLFNDAEGKPFRMLGVCTDITGRKATEQMVQRARDEAERANRTKSDFLAAMSHELRTPLNAIGGYLDLLDLGIHGPVTEQQRHTFAAIKRNQHHLIMLINDVLNFSRIEAGELEYEIRPLNVAGHLREMEPLLRPHADARNIGFELEAGADVIAHADDNRLHQILLNLVTNAAKFTNAGGHIRVWSDADENQARIHVRDNGRGIPADKLDIIFDPFVQVDRKNMNGSEKGVGLGLAISRDLARGMHGDLTVVSAVGEGSTFTVLLPRA